MSLLFYFLGQQCHFRNLKQTSHLLCSQPVPELPASSREENLFRIHLQSSIAIPLHHINDTAQLVRSSYFHSFVKNKRTLYVRLEFHHVKVGS